MKRTIYTNNSIIVKAFYKDFPYPLLLLILLFSNSPCYSQQVPAVDGARAVYARVDSFSLDHTDVDSLYVNDVTGFAVEDTVLFYQSIGMDPWPPGSGDEGKVNSIFNTGKYAIFKIQEILAGQDIIVINSSLPNMLPRQQGEVGQLIKVPSYERARITSSFDFPAWDSINKVGGVFALIASKKLFMEADLDAGGKGFKGAVPYGSYTGDCSSADPGYLDRYFTESATDSAGHKGEGIVKDGYPFRRGFGLLGNAGGGGNGRFSGGGGGSNEGQGGQGGYEISTCGTNIAIGGIGGQPLTSLYTNNPMNFAYNRIFMGGGGGSSTQDPGAGRFATAGGNGGGIVIIVADTIEGNGRAIRANGLSVSGMASAGAGGGGGGGVIVLDVSAYTGDLSLEVRGGKGGDVAGIPDTTGPGGGGGGGVIWHNGLSLPASLNISFTGGDPGRVDAKLYRHGATTSTPGARIGNLSIPIRGFIINTMPDDQVVCEGLLPAPVNANLPKGGTGSYTYKWLQSTDQISWSEAIGVNDQQIYQPPVLSDTTYYRRVVDDSHLIDTSFATAVNVHPRLQNNLIMDDDTVCYNISPGQLYAPQPVTGGYDGYHYEWIYRSNTSSWLSTNDFNESYNVPALTDTTYYSRVVSSGACVDTSNLVTITVLASLTNNVIADDQVICNNQVPEELAGPVPDGGIPGDANKRFKWEAFEGPDWIGRATTQNYQPPSLEEDTYTYRRIVFSGDQDECVDTSNQVEIIALPDIAGNEMVSDDDTICSGLPSITLEATSNLTGGNGNYRFEWQQRNEGDNEWNPYPVLSNYEPLLPGTLNESKWFRRIVYSGPGDVCYSSGDSINIEVLEEISGNIIASNQVICQGSSPEILSGQGLTGGTGDYSYQWEKQADNEEVWNAVESEGGNDEYAPGILNDTMNYRRIVYSGPENTCKDTSNALIIRVQPAISNNDILVQELATCKGTAPELIEATDQVQGGDGNPAYFWQQSPDNQSWSPAAGNNISADYQAGELSTPVFYRRLVQSGSCADTTESILVDTLALPLLKSLSGSKAFICDDMDYFLIIDVKNGTGPYTVEYNNGVDPGVASASFTNDLDSVQTDIEGHGIEVFTYQIISLEDGNGCLAPAGSLMGAPVSVDVFDAPDPQISKPADPYRVCGPELQLSAVPDPDPEVDPGWWTLSNPDFIIESSANDEINLNYSFSRFNSDSAWLYYHQFTPSCGERKDSLQVYLYEEPEEPAINAEEEITLFVVDYFELEASEPTAGSAVWSIESGDAILEDSTDNPVKIRNIPLNSKILIRYTVFNGVCALQSDEVSLLRRPVHVYQGISPANADGYNDMLIAEGLDDPDVQFSLQLFSGSGMLVREISDKDLDGLGFNRGFPDNGLELWDGKDRNGNNYVPSGTYYYALIINYKGREFRTTGFIVVKKDE